jgi:16S rRNA (guanine527-N7)-methyltransferase
MPDPAIPSQVIETAAKLGLSLDERQWSLLSRYLDLLLEANTRFNLTAIRERDAAWMRHIIDSLTILPGLEALEAEATVIDVGSGGGLPGIPIAIARPDLAVTLLEATGKKAQFLRECIAALGLNNAWVVQGRAEEVGQQREHRQHYHAAVCRAIGPMREVLEYTLPLVAVGGLVLAMKGPKASEELAEAGNALDQLGGGDLRVFDAYPEGFDLHTVVVSVLKERPTPRDYPRRPGVPRQEPL